MVVPIAPGPVSAMADSQYSWITPLLPAISYTTLKKDATPIVHTQLITDNEAPCLCPDQNPLNPIGACVTVNESLVTLAIRN